MLNEGFFSDILKSVTKNLEVSAWKSTMKKYGKEIKEGSFLFNDDTWKKLLKVYMMEYERFLQRNGIPKNQWQYMKNKYLKDLNAWRKKNQVLYVKGKTLISKPKEKIY